MPIDLRISFFDAAHFANPKLGHNFAPQNAYNETKRMWFEKRKFHSSGRLRCLLNNQDANTFTNAIFDAADLANPKLGHNFTLKNNAMKPKECDTKNENIILAVV